MSIRLIVTLVTVTAVTIQQYSLSLHPIDPLRDVGQDFGGDGFFDIAVFGGKTSLAMLEEVVERRVLLDEMVLILLQQLLD